jgi:hypothetical protein
MRHCALGGRRWNELSSKIHPRPPFGKPVIRRCTSEAETTPPRLYVSASARVAVSAKKHGGMSRGEESTPNGFGSPRTGRADSRLCGRDAFSVACPACGFAFGGDPSTLANCATARTASAKPHPRWYITSENTSPPRWHPWQKKICRSGCTKNEGCRSRWSGQRPTNWRPQRRSRVSREAKSSRSTRAFTVAASG